MTRKIGKLENEKEIVEHYPSCNEIVEYCPSCNTLFAFTEDDFIKTGPFELRVECPVCGKLIQEL